MVMHAFFYKARLMIQSYSTRVSHFQLDDLITRSMLERWHAKKQEKKIQNFWMNSQLMNLSNNLFLGKRGVYDSIRAKLAINLDNSQYYTLKFTPLTGPQPEKRRRLGGASTVTASLIEPWTYLEVFWT